MVFDMAVELKLPRVRAALIAMMEARSGNRMDAEGWVRHDLRGHQLRSRVSEHVVHTQRNRYNPENGTMEWVAMDHYPILQSFNEFADLAAAEQKSTKEAKHGW